MPPFSLRGTLKQQAEFQVLLKMNEYTSRGNNSDMEIFASLLIGGYS